MKKRKGESLESMPESKRHKHPLGFYTPFRELDQLFGPIFSPDRKHLAKPDPFSEKIGVYPHRIKGEDDESIFRTAMADVCPLPAGLHKKVPIRPPHREYPHFLAREEIEAYTQLVDLVAGEGPFESVELG